MTVTSTTGTENTGNTGDQSGVVIRHVTKTFDTERGEKVTALHDINLTIANHDFICVVGQSGCGKTTLLSMLAGFEKPTEGELLINGRRIERPDAKRGVVFQKPQLYPWLNVRRNVEFGMKVQGVDRARRERIADEYLEMVGLSDAADRRPYELSGGMQQRAQIARVLATDPDLILMDEPFGALDALTRENLQVELRRIWQEKRKTVFFITHSVDEAIFLGTRVIVMTAHPGTVKMDVPVTVPRDPDHPEDIDAVRNTPQFIALEHEISDAIHH